MYLDEKIQCMIHFVTAALIFEMDGLKFWPDEVARFRLMENLISVFPAPSCLFEEFDAGDVVAGKLSATTT